jgi:hypothetical protein
MPKLPRTTNTPAEKPDTADWVEFVDRWLHDVAIRWTLFAAFVCTLATVVLLVVVGGPLALACIFGPLVGGTGSYAAWRRIRDRRMPQDGQR